MTDYPGNWRFPKRDRGYGHWLVNRTRVADRQWKAGVNRINGHPIGLYVVLGDWAYGVCRPISGEERRRKQAARLRDDGRAS